MYVDGYMLFAIYFIAVLALAVSTYALWSLEEIRKYYSKRSTKKNTVYTLPSMPTKKHSTAKGHFDKFIGQ